MYITYIHNAQNAGEVCRRLRLVRHLMDICTRFAGTASSRLVRNAGSRAQRGRTLRPRRTMFTCAVTAGQNEFARDLVGKPCRPVPLIATNTDTCTRCAANVAQGNNSHCRNSRAQSEPAAFMWKKTEAESS